MFSPSAPTPARTARARPLVSLGIGGVAAALLACIDAPIESSAPDAGDNDNGNDVVECPDPGDLDVGEFEDELLGDLDESCTNGACHAPGQNQYEVDAGDPEGSLASFVEFADCDDPASSDVLEKIDGTQGHGGGDDFGDLEGPILDYLETLAQAAGGDPGNGGDNGEDDPAFQAFEEDVQPVLDDTGEAGCAEGTGACHDPGIGGFELRATPVDRAEVQENYEEVLEQVEPGDPDNSTLIQKSTDAHYGDEVSPDELEILETWIESL